MFNILCRVDGNSTIGSGHLMRCLALAQACIKAQIAITFIIAPDSLELCQNREDWVGKIHLLPASLGIQQEIDWIKRNFNLENYDAIVLDGYQFNAQYRAQLNELGLPLVIFDDNNNSGELFAKLVINCSEHAKDLNYQLTAAEAILAIGRDYRVLRQEFCCLEQPIKPLQERKYLSLIMGGSDPLDIIKPLLQKLEQFNAAMPIQVLTGLAYGKLERLQDFIRASNLDIDHFHNCQTVAKRFCDSRLVVSAAGSSQFELLACETPAVLIVVADNQFKATESAAEQGGSQMFDYREKSDIALLTEHIMQLWQQSDVLESMHKKIRSLSDRQGADRVVQKLISLFDNKRSLNI